MADNITAFANTGTGTDVFATDQIAGVHYPKTKLVFGPDDSATDVTSSTGLPVNIANASLAVTGSFYQATQPVSIASTVPVSGPLTDTQLRATPVPVSGTFWQATQPVSGTVGVSGSVAVTGTFWQATQPVSIASAVPVTDNSGSLTVDAPVGTPVFVRLSDGAAALSTLPVSGPLTDTQLRATAVPVSGTFWQATQPVSGTVTAAQATAASLNATVVGTGTFAVQAAQSGTWNIGSITTLPALVAGTALIGKVGIDQTTVGTTNAVSIAQLGAATVLTGVGAAGTGSLRVTLSSDAVTAAAALADAFANPTIGQRAVLNSVFNGTSWDRQRGMSLALTTGDTGAKTATFNGATQTNVGNKGVVVVVNMGTVSGTTPTCTVKMQGSLDGGTTWYDIPGATTAAITATGVYAITVYPGAPTVAGTATSITGTASCGQPLPRSWRIVATIGGTTPSFTFTNVQVIYIPN